MGWGRGGKIGEDYCEHRIFEISKHRWREWSLYRRNHKAKHGDFKSAKCVREISHSVELRSRTML